MLPWVRLHAVKDYYDMVAILDRFPEVHANFNLVPSLLVQIEDYAEGKANDKFLKFTLKDPKELTAEERVFILQNFFMVNWENMIKPYPYYYDLLMKRGRFVSQADLERAVKRFSYQELLDLQVWFNLTWFGFIYKLEDPIISSLIKKGKRFTEEDKKAVIEKQNEIIKKIIPAYRQAQERGQIEISTSPFYHPILPLLCDTDAAKEGMPHIVLPPAPFRHPEDADAQVKLAVEYYISRFGRKPIGMWPSEGSVSERIIPIIAGAGIKWIGTDERILGRSLHKGRSLSAEELCQPYLLEKEGSALSVIFRNQFLSDQIGFVYYRWKAPDAAADFMEHLNNIRVSLSTDRNHLVTIILDGENAWEYYPKGGKEFFEAFYERLRTDPNVRTVKIGQYLEENPPSRKLHKLFAGSWINNNFKIWIGHTEDNTAWDYLGAARLVMSEESPPLAWQELYVAEGSDWCWWYGDDHSCENDAVFDLLFRKHLKNIYQLIGREPPSYLDLPIKKLRLVRPLKEPVYLIQPILDGKITNYYEWLSAGHFDIGKARGTMHQAATILREVFYGFSMTELYVRLDMNFDPSAENSQTLSYSILFLAPLQYKAKVYYSNSENRFVSELIKGSNLSSVQKIETFAVGKIIELGIPFKYIEARPGDRIEFVITIGNDSQELERWPRSGAITVLVPTESYEMEQWSV